MEASLTHVRGDGDGRGLQPERFDIELAGPSILNLGYRARKPTGALLPALRKGIQRAAVAGSYESHVFLCLNGVMIGLGARGGGRSSSRGIVGSGGVDVAVDTTGSAQGIEATGRSTACDAARSPAGR